MTTTTINLDDIEIQLTCEKCGKDLCDQVTTARTKDGDIEIRIEPCPDCLEEEKARGFEEGKKED